MHWYIWGSGVCSSRRLRRHHFDQRVQSCVRAAPRQSCEKKKKCCSYTSLYSNMLALQFHTPKCRTAIASSYHSQLCKHKNKHGKERIRMFESFKVHQAREREKNLQGTCLPDVLLAIILLSIPFHGCISEND